MVERVSKALCQSGKFETGQGGCAAICMSVLGSSRGGPHGCPHATMVHAQLSTKAIEATGVVELLTLARENLGTMQEEVRRCKRWGKSHCELDTAIKESQLTLTQLAKGSE